MYWIMYAYIHIIYMNLCPYVCLYISEMNASNGATDGREESTILLKGTHSSCEVLQCYLKVNLH